MQNIQLAKEALWSSAAIKASCALVVSVCMNSRIPGLQQGKQATEPQCPQVLELCGWHRVRTCPKVWVTNAKMTSEVATHLSCGG